MAHRTTHRDAPFVAVVEQSIVEKFDYASSKKVISRDENLATLSRCRSHG